jgi:5-formyltetrahydrofolate cyclo-ligase
MVAREWRHDNGHWMTVKTEVRDAIWQLLAQEGVVRFPGAQGRIPNFVGAEKAAKLLSELNVWRKAQVIKVNPDAPQLPVRRAALADGKVLYMAVPRLRTEKCFIELDPQKLGSRVLLAASIKGAVKYGRPVSPREMRPVDMVVCGSVAVGRDGARVGKGGGYSDLEYGLLREENRVRELTPIVTTVHRLQIILHKIPMFPHDIPVDFFITPTEVIATRSVYPRPRGIYWDLLRVVKINTIPILRKRMRQGGSSAPRQI